MHVEQTFTCTDTLVLLLKKQLARISRREEATRQARQAKLYTYNELKSILNGYSIISLSEMQMHLMKNETN